MCPPFPSAYNSQWVCVEVLLQGRTDSSGNHPLIQYNNIAHRDQGQGNSRTLTPRAVQLDKVFSRYLPVAVPWQYPGKCRKLLHSICYVDSRSVVSLDYTSARCWLLCQYHSLVLCSFTSTPTLCCVAMWTGAGTLFTFCSMIQSLCISPHLCLCTMKL